MLTGIIPYQLKCFEGQSEKQLPHAVMYTCAFFIDCW